MPRAGEICWRACSPSGWPDKSGLTQLEPVIRISYHGARADKFQFRPHPSATCHQTQAGLCRHIYLPLHTSTPRGLFTASKITSNLPKFPRPSKIFQSRKIQSSTIEHFGGIGGTQNPTKGIGRKGIGADRSPIDQIRGRLQNVTLAPLPIQPYFHLLR